MIHSPALDQHIHLLNSERHVSNLGDVETAWKLDDRHPAKAQVLQKQACPEVSKKRKKKRLEGRTQRTLKRKPEKISVEFKLNATAEENETMGAQLHLASSYYTANGYRKAHAGWADAFKSTQHGGSGLPAQREDDHDSGMQENDDLVSPPSHVHDLASPLPIGTSLDGHRHFQNIEVSASPRCFSDRVRMSEETSLHGDELLSSPSVVLEGSLWGEMGTPRCEMQGRSTIAKRCETRQMQFVAREGETLNQILQQVFLRLYQVHVLNIHFPRHDIFLSRRYIYHI